MAIVDIIAEQRLGFMLLDGFVLASKAFYRKPLVLLKQIVDK